MRHATFERHLRFQTIALSNERNDALIQARRLDASVQLLKALGGGWNRTHSLVLDNVN